MKISLIPLVLILAASFTIGDETEKLEREEFLEKYFVYRIDGRHAEVLESAIAIFREKLDVDLKEYVIVVREEEGKVFVGCWSPRRFEEGILGRIKGFPEYNVVFDANTHKFLEGSYGR